MIVRPFAPDDAPAVAALVVDTMLRSSTRDYPIERLQPVMGYFTPARMIQLAAERYCLVAQDERGRVIATAALDGSELATFFVLPEQQGRGVGARLLDALERHARESGIAKIEVKSSLGGVPFYERRGYERTGAVIDDAVGRRIVLEKTLRDR